MRVLLINSNLKDDILAAPPIGLCYVASAAEVAGHEVKVLDLCFKPHIGQELEKAIIGFAPQVIGVSLRNLDNVNMLRLISYLPSALEIVQQIRALTAAPLVLGGSGASLDPEGVLQFLHGDYLIVSEGEKSFVALLEALDRGQSAAQIPGVAMWRQEKFHLTPPRLTSFPAGNPHLSRWVDLNPYEKMGGSYTIQTKRGCRMQCIYCTYNQVLEGNRLRLRSPSEVVDEIEEAFYQFKPEAFEIVDSVFNDPLGHCQEILEEIIRRPWKARFTTMGVSPKNLDSRFLRLMQRAGFTSFMISPESASDAMLASYQKGFDSGDLRRAAEAINQFSFPVLWNFLIGGPGETNRTLAETLEFIEQHLVRKPGPPHNLANIFLGVRIYPGTKLWQIALDEDFVHDQCSPLQPLWYLSRELDLDATMRQLHQAACRRPEIALGGMEKYMPLTKIFGVIGKIFPFPKPYWQHLLFVNQLLIKLGVRCLFQAIGIPAQLRGYLKLQSDKPSSAPKS